MREREIETYFRQKVKQIGGMALKFVSPGFTGVPDRLIVLPGGKMFFVEFKAPGQVLRPRQEYVIQQIRVLGAKVYVICSKKEVDYFIKNVQEDEV